MKRRRQKRIALKTWTQAEALGFVLFCWDCPRIYKTLEWAERHIDATGHGLGTVSDQASRELRLSEVSA